MCETEINNIDVNTDKKKEENLSKSVLQHNRSPETELNNRRQFSPP